MGSMPVKGAAANAARRTESHSHSSMYSRRRAHHAGSWYDANGDDLRRTLESYLNQVVVARPPPPPPPTTTTTTTTTSLTSTLSVPQPPTQQPRLRAVICPHAGYAYSGPTAAYAYTAILTELLQQPHQFNSSSNSNSGGRSGTLEEDPNLVIMTNPTITQILVLHPSHHVSLPGVCAVSGATTLATPIGDLRVDDALRHELLHLHHTNSRSSGSSSQRYSFSVMTASQDEQEHSGEMQYPFLAYCLAKAGRLDTITVTPIMCGSLTTDDEVAYGELLSDICARPNVLTVVSSDFCHWGRRFAYQPVSTTTSSGGTLRVPIHEFIEQLDRRGMDAIAAQQPGAFAFYLRATKNTVCGRHAIAVWLRAVTAAAPKHNANDGNDNETTKPTCRSTGRSLSIEFIKYAQSSACKTMSDSSVSYAAAIATIGTSPTNES